MDTSKQAHRPANEPELGRNSMPETITREEFQRATRLRPDQSAGIARREKHEFRKVWVLWVPAGFMLAFFITLATDMGTTGFFFAWFGCTVVIWGIGDAVIGDKGPSE